MVTWYTKLEVKVSQWTKCGVSLGVEERRSKHSLGSLPSPHIDRKLQEAQGQKKQWFPLCGPPPPPQLLQGGLSWVWSWGPLSAVAREGLRLGGQLDLGWIWAPPTSAVEFWASYSDTQFPHWKMGVKKSKLLSKYWGLNDIWTAQHSVWHG